MFKYFKVTSNFCVKVAVIPLNILQSILKPGKNLFSIKSNHLSDKDKIANDWKRIGNDMWKSVLKYDQEAITQKK